MRESNCYITKWVNMFKSPPPTIHYSFHMAIKNNIYIEYDTSWFHSVRPWFVGQAQKVMKVGPVQWICREWVKELGPMNWTTVSVVLEDDPTSIKGPVMNMLNVRGGNVSFQLTKQITSASILATVFFLIFFSFFPLGFTF